MMDSVGQENFFAIFGVGHLIRNPSLSNKRWTSVFDCVTAGDSNKI